MASTQPFRKTRIVFQRSPLLLKVVLIVALAASTVTLLVLRASLLDKEKENEELRQEIVALEQENHELNRKNENLGSVESDMELAGEYLDLVDPDTIIFETKPEE